METPPITALAEARQRMQTAASSAQPGTIRIGGAEYAAAVAVHAETVDLTDRGLSKVQRMEAMISKSVLATAPRQGAIVSTGGRSFRLVEVRGYNTWDTSWHMVGERSPGAEGGEE